MDQLDRLKMANRHSILSTIRPAAFSIKRSALLFGGIVFGVALIMQLVLCTDYYRHKDPAARLYQQAFPNLDKDLQTSCPRDRDLDALRQYLIDFFPSK